MEARQLMSGMFAGLFIGVFMGLLIGGPTAIITYGSINDAVLNGKHYDFSLDNYTTDVPPSVLAKRIEDNWDAARTYIWWQLQQSIIVCCCVGLGSGLIATVAATAAQDALSGSSHNNGQWDDIRAKLLPMR
eukprot:CAMPEP_0179406348 /NCGR_PEP_ID=MMETSP0799-20121207/837_1 /TAXON_ID=46947 /ORGANISM="Geminigera cryophila, Strain CCMP2564" /LENGTH=131 /DNA_ID=CAMNT_0021177387 /DNA_START=81 /DNA_END=476 /DNA_ORIENTATION=+